MRFALEINPRDSSRLHAVDSSLYSVGLAKLAFGLMLSSGLVGGIGNLLVMIKTSNENLWV